MNCRNVVHKLSAYIDGELTGTEMLAVRSHLSTCHECATEEKSIRAFKRLLGSLPCVEPPSGLEDRLVGAIRSDRRSWHWWPQVRVMGYAACVVALAMLISLNLAKPRTPETLPTDSNNVASFEVSRDQAYVAGGDPLGVGPVALPVNYASR